MSPLLIATGVFALLLGSVAAFDIRTQRIPDALNALLVGAGLAATIVLERDLVAVLIGVFAGYGALWLINALYRMRRGADGIGMGDAKLAAGLGAWIGWTGLPFAALIAAAAGLAFVALTRIVRGAAPEALAFGPFLAAGGFLVWAAQAFV